MKDLHSNISVEKVVIPKAYTTGITGTAEVDLKGYNSCEFIFDFGVYGDTLGSSVKHTVLVTHADDTGAGVAGSYANVAAGDILGATPSSGICLTVLDNADCSQVYRFGYVGGKRFVTILITAVGTHSTGTIIGASVIKGDPENGPVANTAPTV